MLFGGGVDASIEHHSRKSSGCVGQDELLTVSSLPYFIDLILALFSAYKLDNVASRELLLGASIAPPQPSTCGNLWSCYHTSIPRSVENEGYRPQSSLLLVPIAFFPKTANGMLISLKTGK